MSSVSSEFHAVVYKDLTSSRHNTFLITRCAKSCSKCTGHTAELKTLHTYKPCSWMGKYVSPHSFFQRLWFCFLLLHDFRSLP